jgi:hypothetical protein
LADGGGIPATTLKNADHPGENSMDITQPHRIAHWRRRRWCR